MATRRNTKHRRAIEALFTAQPGEHLNAHDVQMKLSAAGSTASAATVYRQLEALVDDGILRKYDNGSGVPACYTFTSEGVVRNDDACFHCVCTSCGKLIHLNCSLLVDIRHHIAAEHGFTIDPRRTVLHGLCADCAKA